MPVCLRIRNKLKRVRTVKTPQSASITWKLSRPCWAKAPTLMPGTRGQTPLQIAVFDSKLVQLLADNDASAGTSTINCGKSILHVTKISSELSESRLQFDPDLDINDDTESTLRSIRRWNSRTTTRRSNFLWSIWNQCPYPSHWGKESPPSHWQHSSLSFLLAGNGATNIVQDQEVWTMLNTWSNLPLQINTIMSAPFNYDNISAFPYLVQ